MPDSAGSVRARDVVQFQNSAPSCPEADRVLLLAGDPRKRFTIRCHLPSSTRPGFGCSALNYSAREAVRAYNTALRTFPALIWAKTVFAAEGYYC